MTTATKSSRRERAVGTARIISTYRRPELFSLSKEEFKRRTEKAKKLNPNTWLIHIKPNHVMRGAYITLVGLRNEGKYYVCEIPTNKKGEIPQINMAERLLDTEDGDRTGAMRNVMVDVGIDAAHIHNEKDLAKVYRWYIHPNESDVSRIDDAKTMIAEIMGKGKKWGKSKVLIVGGTHEQRERIAADLTANFTVKEKRLIHNCLIEIVSNGKPYAGCFQGTTDASGNIIGTPRIAICERHVQNSGTIIHEAVHALREFDLSRDRKITAVEHYVGKDVDLEESLTEAETTGRQRPFTKHEESAGYYHYLKIGTKSRGELITEDRITITGSLHKGLKGKRVQKAVIKQFPLTNIAHLKIKGGAEAIDTFREVERRTKNRNLKTSLHMFNPDGNAATDRAQDQALAKETTGAITQWDDGKATVVQKQQKTTPTVNVYGVPIEKPVSRAVKSLVDKGLNTISSGYHSSFSEKDNGLKPCWCIVVQQKKIPSPILVAIEKAGLKVHRRGDWDLWDIYLPKVGQKGADRAARVFNNLSTRVNSIKVAKVKKAASRLGTGTGSTKRTPRRKPPQERLNKKAQGCVANGGRKQGPYYGRGGARSRHKI